MFGFVRVRNILKFCAFIANFFWYIDIDFSRMKIPRSVLTFVWPKWEKVNEQIAIIQKKLWKVWIARATVFLQRMNFRLIKLTTCVSLTCFNLSQHFQDYILIISLRKYFERELFETIFLTRWKSVNYIF